MRSDLRDEILFAVSDGEPIEWDALRRRHADPDSSGWIDALAEVARVGRSAPGSHATYFPEARMPPWQRVLLLVAATYVAIGAIGRSGLMPSGPLFGLRLATVSVFAISAIALLRNDGDLRARYLGFEFLLVAAAFARQGHVTAIDAWLGNGRAATVARDALTLDAFLPYFLWQFTRRFPITSRFAASDRVAQAAARAALWLAWGLLAANFVTAVWPSSVTLLWWAARSFDAGQRYSAVLFACMLPAFPVMLIRARSAPAPERRRVRVFGLAFLVGSVPALLEVTAEALVPGYANMLRGSPSARATVTTLAVVPLLTVPVVTAYAVLVHRLLGVRTAIHQGLQYLLARYTLAALTMLPFGLLVIVVYLHRKDSVVDILSTQAISLLAAGVLGIILLAARSALTRLVDRWFKRGHVGTTTALAIVSQSLRQARTPDDLVQSVATAARSVLACEACVCLFDQRRHVYSAFDSPEPTLRQNSAILSVLMDERSTPVLDVGHRSRIRRLLPAAEVAWLDRLGAVLIVPIAHPGGAEHPAGMIAFRERGDAFGFSGEDERFVLALAEAVSMALERVGLHDGLAGHGEDLAEYCERCLVVADSPRATGCEHCGGSLARAPLPRFISTKFRLERVVGAGGMGVVFLATDLLLERAVALKTLPRVSRPAALGLRQEARTMGALMHPYLATIHGIEVWRGTPLLVCEYLEGGTLDRRIRSGPLDDAEAIALGLQLLEALEYMHSRHVMHRDLKPSNVGFSGDGTPKLLDFGLARLAEPPAVSEVDSARLEATTLAGTVAYLSPEAFGGAPPDPSFDFWALCVMLFEAVSGRHPFADGASTRRNVVQRRMVADRGRAGTLPHGLASVLTGPWSGYRRSDDVRRVLDAARVRR